MRLSLQILSTALLAWMISLSTEARSASFFTDDLNPGKAIFIVGEIEVGDEKKFRSIAMNIDDAVVVLESNGGSTVAAIEIGKTIQIKGFSTAVFNGSVCNSACGLIWISGATKALSRSASIGFHATYVNSDGKNMESGAGNAIVGRYLTLLNLPENAIIFMTMAPPGKLNYLNSDNASALGVAVHIAEDISSESDGDISKSTAVKSSGTTLWRRTGNWRVMADETLGDTCFVLAEWEKGTAIRIGFRSDDGKKGYFFVGNLGWTSLEMGKDYRLTLEFDNFGPWNFPAVGKRMETRVFLYAEFENDLFWSEFAEANGVHISYKGSTVASLELQGSRRAMEEMIKCQKNQNVRIDDPFSR